MTEVDTPGGLSGYDLVEVTGLKALPIVVTSGTHRPAGRALPESGCFVSKPYRLDDVCNVLASRISQADLITAMAGRAS